MKSIWLFLSMSFLALSQSTNSPNMNLPIPIVGQTSGPQWAQNINSSLTRIDAHDHTPGNGVPITPAGMNINTNLAFGGFSATNLQAAVLAPQSAYSTNYGVHVEGADLYYVDGNGNDVRITSGGTVNATSSGISSGTATASFSAGVLVVNSASLTPASIKAGSYLMGNNTASSHYLTLAPPNAMAADYTLNLPTIPGSTSFVTLDVSGNLAGSISTSAGLTGSNLAAATVTGSNIASATVTGSNVASSTLADGNIVTASLVGPVQGIQPNKLDSITIPYYIIGSSSGSYTGTSTLTAVTNMDNVTLPNSAPLRPRLIYFHGADTTAGVAVTSGDTMTWQVIGANGSGSVNLNQGRLVNGGSSTTTFPCSTFNTVDVVGRASSAPLTKYTLKIAVTGGSGATITNCFMAVMQY